MLKKINELRKRVLKADLKKSGYNSFVKFKYYELADFLPTVIELENELGLLSAFSIDNDLARLKVYDTESGEVVEFVSQVRDANVEKMIEVQRLGSIHTYIKRYLYYNYLNLTENDTVDSLDNAKVQEKKEPTETREQLESWFDLLATDDEKQKSADYYGGEVPKAIPLNALIKIVEKLKKK